jgi:hypothetical protein
MLNGFEAPDLAEQKQRKVAERAEAKRALMGGNGVRQTAEQLYKSPSEKIAAGERITARDLLESNNRSLGKRQESANDYLAEQEVREEKSWATDAELGSFSGQAKQLTGGVAVSGARAAGNFVGMPLTLSGQNKMNRVDDEARELYANDMRYNMQKASIQKARTSALADNLRGELNEDDLTERMAAFDKAESSLVPLNDEQNAKLDADGTQLSTAARSRTGNSNRALMRDALSNFDKAGDFDEFFNENEFIDGLVNPLNKQAMSADFEATFAKHSAVFDEADKAYEAGDMTTALLKGAEGIAKLTFEGAGDVWNNPAALAEYLSESSVDLALGAVARPLMAASNIGYGVDIYREALQRYRDENDGAVFSKADGQKVFAISMTAAAAEHMMDASFLRGFVGSSTAADTAVDVVKKGIASRLARGLVKKTGKVAGKTVGEGATEGFQTAVEETYSDLRTDVDGANIFEASMIGGGIGKSLAIAGELRGDPVARRAKRAQDARVEASSTKEARDAVEELVTSGDIDTLLDPEFKGDLGKVGEALIVSAAGKTDTPEIQENSRKALDRLDERLDSEITELNTRIKETSPESITALKAQLARSRGQVSKAKRDGDTAAQTKAEAAVSLYVDELNLIEKVPAATRKKQKTHVAELTRLRTRISETQTQATAETGKLESVETLVSQTQDVEADPVARTEAAKKTINLAMANPDLLDQESAAKMADDTELSLSADERQYLRALSGRKQAFDEVKTLTDVNKDIFTNNPSAGFKSIPQYQSSIGRAIQEGNTARVDQQLAQLKNFAQSHTAKSKLAEEMLAQAVPGKKQAQIISTDREGAGSVWELNTGKKLSDAQMAENGGMNINTGSTGLVNAVTKEAAYIEQALGELQAASRISQTNAPVANDPAPEATQEADTPTDTVEAEPVAETVNETDPTQETDSRTEEDATQAEPTEAEPETNQPVDTETAPEPTGDPEVRDGDNALAQPVEETDAGRTSDTRNDAPESVEVEARKEQDAKTSVLRRDTAPTTEKVDGFMTYDELNTKNLAQAYFTTEKGLVLTANEDYLTNVLMPGVDNPQTLGVELSTDETVEAKQRAALRHFAEYANKWNKSMDGLLKPGSKNYKYRNLLNAYMDENGNLEENVRTAVSAAVYTWISENGNDLWFNNGDDALRTIFAMESHERVGVEHQALVGDAGTRDKYVINDIGKRVTAALGQRLNDTAPGNYAGQLDGAFGALALIVMIEQKLVQRVAKRSTLFGLKADAKGDLPIQWFVRSNRVQETVDGPWQTNPMVESFVETNRGSKDVVSKLFEIEPTQTGPVDEAPTKVMKTTRRTKQPVPKEQEAILKEAQKQEHFLRTDMLDPVEGILHKFSRNFMKQMAGGVTFDPATTQDQLVPGLRGKDEAASRDVDNLFNFSNEKMNNMEAPFFFDRSVWRNQRVGLLSSLYNPQSSKLHRFTFTMKDWAYDVPADLSGKAGADFKLSVLEGLGVKTDKQLNASSLDQWENHVNDPETVAAVKVVQGMLSGGAIKDAAQENQLLSVAKNMHGLDTLVHLAHWKNAQALGNDSFESNLIREGDGVTNGPMFVQIQLGTVDDAMGARGGFFNAEQGFKSTAAYLQAGNHDMYMYTAHKLATKMDIVGAADPDVKAFNALVYRLHGDIKNTDDSVTGDGRNAVKPLLTKLMFGAGSTKSVTNMGHDTVDLVYEELNQMMELYGNTPELSAAAGKLFNEINKFLSAANKLPTKSNFATVKAFKFSDNARTQLINTFTELVGTHINETVDEQYGTTIERRNSFNGSAQMSFKLYEIARNFERRKIMKESVAKGEVAIYKATGEVLQDLLKAHEKELDKRMSEMSPVVHTAMSKGGDKQAGLKMAKQRQDLADGSKWRYTGVVNLKRPVTLAPGKINDGMTLKGVNNDPNKKTTIDYRSSESKEVDPGVSPVIMLIHAMDSAIISRVYKAVNMLNVHDAVIRTPAGLQEAMASMNQETLNAMLSWSLPEEIMQTMYRTLDEFQQKLPEMQKDPEFRVEHEKLLAGLDKSPTLMAEEYLAVAEQAERDTMEWMQTISIINQYGYEGGHYTVTDADRVLMTERQSTTIRERVNTRLNKDIAQSNVARVAEASRVLQENLEQAYRDQVESGKGLSKAQKRELENMRQVNKIFMETGSLERALGTVYKGEAYKAARNTKRAEIHARLTNQDQRIKDVEKAPVGRVLDMIAAITESTKLDDGMKTDLGNVAESVEMHWKVAQTSGTGMNTVLQDAVKQVTQDTKQQAAIMGLLNTLYNGRQVTPWGVLGTPVSDSDAVLVKALRAQPVMTVKELLPVLRTALKSRTLSNNDRAVAQVLGQLSKRLDESVVVELVEQSTRVSLAPEMGNPGGVRGVTQIGDTTRVFLKGPDFVESNLTVELVAHELLHVLLANTLQAERAAQAANPKHRSNITGMVNELETLRSKAADLVKTDSALQARFGDAVTSVDELISWGLTNEGFQREVLGKIQMTSRTKKNALIVGMEAFINTIRNIVFQGVPTTEQQNNGITVLINNASGVIAATKPKQKAAYETVLAQQTPDILDTVSNYTTREIYEGLDGDTSPRLQRVMDVIVDKLHGPYGATKLELDRTSGISAEDAYLNALVTDTNPFSSKTAATNLDLSDKEAFVLEQVEASLREILDPTTSAYKDLVRVFKSTREQMSWESFIDGELVDATPTQVSQAKAKYDFIFKLEQSSGETRSNHLSRFAAMAMAYPGLADKMDFNVSADNRAASSKMGDQLQSWYRKAVQQFADTVNGTAQGQTGQQRMTRLVTSLVDIESRKRRTLARKNIGLLDQIEEASAANGGVVRRQLGNLAGRPALANSNSSIIRASSRVTRLIADDKFTVLLDTWEDYRADAFGKQQGFLAKMVDEVRGPKEGTQEMHDFLSQTGKHEQERKHRIDNSKKQLLGLLGEMTKAESEGITKSVLKTDLVSLSTRLGYEGMTDLMANKDAQATLRKDLEAELNQVGKEAAYYKNMAQALGYHMAVGHQTKGLLLNVHNIVRKVGMPDAMTVPEATMEQATPILEMLTSLYALQHTPMTQQESTKEIMQRNNGEGMRFVIQNHRVLKEQALDVLFQGSPALMQKGYTKEIYDPYREVVTANEKQGAQLVKAGYSKGKALTRDPADTNQEVRHLYVLKEGGLGKYVTGVMSFSGKRSKGTTIHNGVSVVTDEGVVQSRKRMTDKVTANMKNMQDLEKPGFNDDLGTTAKDGALVAVVNPNGEIVNYRYLMTEQNKDDILKRDSRVEDVMGAMEGAVYDKPTSETQNNLVVKALKDQFDVEYSIRPGIYVDFSADSMDAGIREKYALLPEATRRTILKTWGRNGMMVRNDLLDLTFGYRKFSMADTFDLAEKERNILEHVVYHLGTKILGDKAVSKIHAGEDVWQSLVKELKDIYVIKNLWTLVGNIMSNVTLLLWYGVPMKDLIRNHKVAIDGLLSYQTDSDSLLELTRLKEASGRTDLDQQILELEYALENNPVKTLIDGGQFQTIMEDIDTEDNMFSYKSRLVNWADNKTAKVPNAVKTVAKTAYMAHDTPLYKILFRSTQMSDFVGRYTLYEHLTKNANTKKSEVDAMRIIKAAFINYDVPTSKALQYLNDTGLVLFSKYYLRIQRVLLELYQEHPARAILLAILGGFMTGLTTIQDSSMFGRVGNNPFETGALDLPGALDETLVMQGALSPFN